jgi:ParB family chromosome partitioning protein
MAGVEKMMARLGANMIESMSGPASGAGRGSTPAVAPGNAGVDPLAGTARLRGAARIELDRLVPDPGQPRQEFDEDDLDRLARSLTERGQLQPARVRWDSSLGKYVLICGERRWRAAVKAGLKMLDCLIVEGDLPEELLREEQLIENVHRSDLQPLEQARAYKGLMDRLGLSYRELADRLHLSHTAVFRAVSLLELPSTVQQHVEVGTLSPSAAYEVSKLADPAEQVELADRAAAEGLTRADVVEAVKASKVGMKPGSARPAKREIFRDALHRLTLSGPALDAGDEAVVEVLRLAIKAIQKGAKARRGEAA